jgi:Uma2 family endonuclease
MIVPRYSAPALDLETLNLPYLVRVFGVTGEMFDELTDEDTKAELFDGVMIVHSPASTLHDDVGGFLRALMRFYTETKKLGKVWGPDMIVRVAPRRRFAPDLLFIAKGRVPRPRPKQFEGAPDLALEVRSPSNRDYDLDDKRPAYREAGVREIWLVDPDEQEITVDRWRGADYATKTYRRGKVASRVVAGFWIDAAWLWADPLPDLPDCLRALLP